MTALVNTAQGETNTPFDIKGTSLSELMSLKITSLSKKKQQLNRAPAAVYVLSSDEIQRMGVTHIAEALRFVPGVEVAKVDSSRWAIGIRGFTSRASNKLLVMIDGRSIYSPFFSGVLWEEKDVVLADVDRIEVIRGPGGAVWGANAVNGIINIISKNSSKTVGTLVEGKVTSEQNGMIQARQGWKVSTDSYLRFYVKQRERSDTGHDVTNDDSLHRQAGFRFDHNFDPKTSLTLQGDIYRGEIGSMNTTEQPAGQKQHGGNFLMNWSHSATSDRRHGFQAFYDATDLEVTGLQDRRNTLDVSYQVQQNWSQNELVVGAGYRRVRDDVDTMFISPEHRTNETFNAFFQNDLALMKDLHFIFGTKYEDNDYTGSEWQPNVRLSYFVWDSLLWTSWSKAVRVPTRLETDITIPGLNGDKFTSEEATVYEFGWRKRWSTMLQTDITLYQSDYDSLLSLELDGIRNKLAGRTRGVEISASIQPMKEWLLRINMSHAEMDLDADHDSFDFSDSESQEDGMPQNMAQLSSLLDIAEDWQLNAYLRYVDSIETNNIESYMVGDLSLVWKINDSLTANLTGKNIGDGSHEEWTSGVPVDDEYGLSLKWEMP
ncbi:TonB-dependent receptor [Litoribrevibacter albus]|uniref:TonB-dependent receptor n=2 Tax=Litoribrevibacter albus TaxID=1473156 RepID=A0AA37S861_9GAMM|nr:TonB-dependent receptor [Litoribrevibacter albus]